MDPPEKLLVRYDTTITLMLETQRRGHAVFFAEPKNLFLTTDDLFVRAKQVAVDRRQGFTVKLERLMPVADADCVWVRKDPTVNLEYFYMTYLLERAEDRVLCINSPRAIRNANEKLLPFHFTSWMPPSIVSPDSETILSFQRKINSDLILKPLNRKAGEGILLLPRKSSEKHAILSHATSHGRKTIIAQKFLRKGLTEGDKRLLLLDGDVIGAFGRVPRKKEYRANLSRGGTSVKTMVTTRETAIVRDLKPFLRQKGLFFVGLDVVDGFVTEINVTSPAGIWDINELYGRTIERTVIDWTEKKAMQFKNKSRHRGVV